MRVVRAPDRGVTIDPSGKLAGRGAYVCAACRSDGRTTKALERALETTIPAELVAELAHDDEMTIEGGARGQE